MVGAGERKREGGVQGLGWLAGGVVGSSWAAACRRLGVEREESEREG
jgi:hypothetical protein